MTISNKELVNFFMTNQDANAPISEIFISDELRAYKQNSSNENLHALMAREIVCWEPADEDFLRDDEDLTDLELVEISGKHYLKNKRGYYMDWRGKLYFGICEKCGKPRGIGYQKAVNVITDVADGNDVFASAKQKYLCAECVLKFGYRRITAPDGTIYLCDIEHGSIKDYVYVLYYASGYNCQIPAELVPRAVDGKPYLPGDKYIANGRKCILVENIFHAFNNDTPYFVYPENFAYAYAPERKFPFVCIDKTNVDKEKYTFIKGTENLDLGLNCGFGVYVKRTDVKQYKRTYVNKDYAEVDDLDAYEEEYGPAISEYHDWTETYVPLVMPDEDPKNTILYGIELETEGDEDNIKYILPYNDLCHCEKDGSLDDSGIEIIFNPMSWRFLISPVTVHRLSAMFSALRAHGQISGDSSSCGLHVHVSYMPLGTTDAERERTVERIVAIVNGHKNNIQNFARRYDNHYASYNENIRPYDRKISITAVKDDIESGSRYHVVNCCNYRRFVPTNDVDGRNKNTIEIRSFKGSLNTVTVLASVELVKHIVEQAMSENVIVTFNDLIGHGLYIPEYIFSRNRRGYTFTDEVVYLGYLDMSKAAEDYYSGNISDDDFMALCHKIKTRDQEIFSRIGDCDPTQSSQEIPFPVMPDETGVISDDTPS